MLRWITRILIGLCGILIAALTAGASYQWIATRNYQAATDELLHMTESAAEVRGSRHTRPLLS